MRHSIVAILLVLLASAVAAREYIMYPVEVEIKVESNQVRVHVASRAGYWMDEIMHVPVTFSMPATHWPDQFESSSRTYLERCFQIEMDHRPLSIGSFKCRFVQEPFQPIFSRVVFDLSYPIAAAGKRLSGKARFFPEVREEELKEKDHPEGQSEFRTRLKVVGPKEIALDLPFDKPDFDISLDGMIFTENQKRAERTRAAAMRVISSPFFWIALVALGFQAYRRFFKRSEE